MQSTDKVMEQVIEKIATLPDDKQFLLSTTIENILNGSNWGFMDKSVAKVYREPEQFQSETLKIFKVKTPKEGNSITLVESEVKTALKTLQSVAPQLVDKKFIEDYLTKVKENEKSFISFVESALKGKGFKGYIGVYSINSTNTMTYRKERHKAFQLPLRTVLGALANRPVLVSIGGNYVPVNDLVRLDEQRLVSLFTVSEGSTSVVVPIAIKGSK